MFPDSFVQKTSLNCRHVSLTICIKWWLNFKKKVRMYIAARLLKSNVMS